MQIIHYLRSLQSVYEIGAAYDQKYSKVEPVRYFDAIIFIDKVEASNRFDFEK